MGRSWSEGAGVFNKNVPYWYLPRVPLDGKNDTGSVETPAKNGQHDMAHHHAEVVQSCLRGGHDAASGAGADFAPLWWTQGERPFSGVLEDLN